jgi:hypothetical protein
MGDRRHDLNRDVRQAGDIEHVSALACHDLSGPGSGEQSYVSDQPRDNRSAFPQQTLLAFHADFEACVYLLGRDTRKRLQNGSGVRRCLHGALEDRRTPDHQFARLGFVL